VKLKALRASGRFSVTVAMPSGARSKRISGMGFLGSVLQSMLFPI
jgi:hypothetical protein